MLGKSMKETEHLYRDTQEKIVTELSQGHGEYIEEFLRQMGCEEKEQEKVISESRNEYGQFVMMNAKNQFNFFKSKCRNYCWGNTLDI